MKSIHPIHYFSVFTLSLLLAVCCNQAIAENKAESAENKIALEKAEQIFENLYVDPNDKLLAAYSVRVKISRTSFDADGKEIKKVIAPENVRPYLREWVRAEQKKGAKHVEYNLPTYTIEGDEKVRVETVRIEKDPHAVRRLSLLVGKEGNNWRIIEDTWSDVTR